MRQRAFLLFVLALLSAANPSRADFSYLLEFREDLTADPITVLTWSPDGDFLLVSSGETTSRFQVTNEGLLPSHQYEQPAGRVTAAAISPQGDRSALVDDAGNLYVFDSEGRQLSRTQKTHKKGATAVDFTLDGRSIITGGQRGDVRVWTPSGILVSELTENLRHEGPLVLVAAAGPGRQALTIDEEGQVILWDVDTQRPVRPTMVDFDIRSAAVTASGSQLVLGLRRLQGNLHRSAGLANAREIRSTDKVRLIDTSKGTLVRDLEGGDQNLDAVALSPDGRFVAAAGSQGSAVIWQVDTGSMVSKVPFGSPVTQLSFSPDGQWLAGGSEAGEVSLFRLEGVESTPTSPTGGDIFIFIMDPEVKVAGDRSSAPPPLVDRESLRVRGRVRSDHPVRSIVVDGHEVTSLVPEEGGDLLFTAFVPLPEAGQKAIDVLVEDETGNRARERFSVRRSETVRDYDPGRGRRLALIVGVSDYADSTLDLEYADDDAQALYDLFTSEQLGPAKFHSEDVMLLLDRDATATRINTGLRQFLQKAREDDFVVFFFAGHGVPDPNRLQDLYLMPHDSEADNIAGTGILMRHVREAIASIRARDVLILTDACHSAGMAGAGGVRNLTVNPIHQEFLERMRHSSGGLAILTASEAAQSSYELDKRGHGVFTYHLLRGLQGEADEDGDDIVALGELMEFVRTSVKNETSAKQVPTIGPTLFDRKLPLALVP